MEGQWKLPVPGDTMATRKFKERMRFHNLKISETEFQDFYI